LRVNKPPENTLGDFIRLSRRIIVSLAQISIYIFRHERTDFARIFLLVDRPEKRRFLSRHDTPACHIRRVRQNAQCTKFSIFTAVNYAGESIATNDKSDTNSLYHFLRISFMFSSFHFAYKAMESR